MQYRIIDADSHVNEPADVWQSRVPVRLREMAPKMVTMDDGKIGWSFEGGKRFWRVTTATAGISEAEYTASGVTYDQIRPGSYDARARLEEMEYDMIQAQVLYPSVPGSGGDRELQQACGQAYNDWVHEFCSPSPDRLIGLPQAPGTGIEDVMGEWHRVSKRGDRGFVIKSYPNGGLLPAPEDERFWSEVQEWEYPIHIHFGFAGGLNLTSTTGVGYLASAGLIDMGLGVYRPLAEMVYGGLFERFPKLKIVAVETGVGWIPHYLETLDDNFLRRRFRAGVHLKEMPSEYFKRHVWTTFINDPHGLENRHRFNVDHIMWSTDYPHTNSNWPNSQRTIAYEFRNVPDEDRKKILCDNARKLYHLG